MATIMVFSCIIPVMHAARVMQAGPGVTYGPRVAHYNACVTGERAYSPKFEHRSLVTVIPVKLPYLTRPEASLPVVGRLAYHQEPPRGHRGGKTPRKT